MIATDSSLTRDAGVSPAFFGPLRTPIDDRESSRQWGLQANQTTLLAEECPEVEA
jgi:hypothetical protein